MQTQLADFIRDTPEGAEAREILRTCVHCGFCTADCPTYRLLGDELDGPRGRIYLMKQMLEGKAVSRRTQLHLDRCLTCRACETACPSGVRYGRLLDIGRTMAERKISRSWVDRVQRRLLRVVLPKPARFALVFKVAQRLRPLLPAAVKRKIPQPRAANPWPEPRHDRKVLLLDGCVQQTLAPTINEAAARVLDRVGISAIRVQDSGCCGALSHHLTAQQESLGFLRRNIEAWWPYVVSGAEAIVTTASGCGVMVKDYGNLLHADPEFTYKAGRVAELAKDIGEVLAPEDCSALTDCGQKIAFHSPCTLQHGQQLGGLVEDLLSRLGFRLTPVADVALCCGSAGTYSILQPELSGRLLKNKIAALEAGGPDLIATANIGCLVHLQSAAEKPVCHWIEVVAEGLEG